MRKMTVVAATTCCVAVVLAPTATSDPTVGNFVNVRTASPPMRCEVGSDDSSGVPGLPGMGPNVVCQTSGFPEAPMEAPPSPGWTGDPSVLHRDQAVITASGQFSWRTANLGMAPPGQPDVTLAVGQRYEFQGWTIDSTTGGTTFTDAATGHGMFIDRDYRVDAF